jgi:hypothetical protein
MTVDEARKKVCPMTFFEGGCIGPKCMAWRWFDRWFDTEIKTDGYCGLAGREGAE